MISFFLLDLNCQQPAATALPWGESLKLASSEAGIQGKVRHRTLTESQDSAMLETDPPTWISEVSVLC